MLNTQRGQSIPVGDAGETFPLHLRDHQHHAHDHAAEQTNSIAQNSGGDTAGSKRQIIKERIRRRRVILTVTFRKDPLLFSKIWEYYTRKGEKKQ